MGINQKIDAAIKRARREVILENSYTLHAIDYVAAADYVYAALGKAESYYVAVEKMFTK